MARAGTSIDEEQHKDVWDLSVLGFGGKANFAGIGQSWLRDSAKRWVAEDLPKRRGAPRAVIGGRIDLERNPATAGRSGSRSAVPSAELVHVLYT
jgi:hypothetical protein